MRALTPLTPNTVELIPTRGARSFGLGPTAIGSVKRHRLVRMSYAAPFTPVGGFRGSGLRVPGPGFWVLGCGFGVWGLGSEVWGLGFGAWGLGFTF